MGYFKSLCQVAFVMLLLHGCDASDVQDLKDRARAVADSTSPQKFVESMNMLLYNYRCTLPLFQGQNMIIGDNWSLRRGKQSDGAKLESIIHDGSAEEKLSDGIFILKKDGSLVRVDSTDVVAIVVTREKAVVVQNISPLLTRYTCDEK